MPPARRPDRSLAAPRERAACSAQARPRPGRRHAGDRLLARRIDLGEKHGVGRCERRAEFAREIARARIEMRLERGDEPAARKRDARGGERRGDLGRMVRVVVDHRHAARFAESLEPPLRRRRTIGEPACHRGEPSAPSARPARERRERVEHIVTPGNGQLDRAEMFVVEDDIESSSTARRDVDERRRRPAARRATRSRSE